MNTPWLAPGLCAAVPDSWALLVSATVRWTSHVSGAHRRDRRQAEKALLYQTDTVLISQYCINQYIQNKNDVNCHSDPHKLSKIQKKLYYYY